MTTTEDVTVPSVEVLRVQPGDVVVYTHSRKLNIADVEQFTSQLHRLFPDNDVCIIEDGAKISLMRADD